MDLNLGSENSSPAGGGGSSGISPGMEGQFQNRFQNSRFCPCLSWKGWNQGKVDLGFIPRKSRSQISSLGQQLLIKAQVCMEIGKINWEIGKINWENELS